MNTEQTTTDVNFRTPTCIAGHILKSQSKFADIFLIAIRKIDMITALKINSLYVTCDIYSPYDYFFFLLNACEACNLTSENFAT